MNRSITMFAAIGIMLLCMIGCGNKPHSNLQACQSRHYIVNASTKLTANQRDFFEAAMTSWSTALGEGFWTWEIQDADVDIKTAQEVDAEIDPCFITVIPADVELIGQNHAGQASTLSNKNTHHLVGGVVEILVSIDDEKSLTRISLHEIGHLLGLDDSYDTSSIMYYSIDGPPIDGLPAQDVEEVKRIWQL